MKFVLPPLPYEYGALEPYIDAQTMEIHHSKHHQAYINNLTVALERFPEFQPTSAESLLLDLPAVPDDIRAAVRNNAGGHFNHSLFWQIMKPNGGGKPNGLVADEIKKTFGTFEDFQTLFNTQAKSVFGSGWAWLIKNKNGGLEIISTPNQDSPLMDGNTPILGVDVWEHAYYLKYQNRRADYLKAWWNVTNWDAVAKNYA